MFQPRMRLRVHLIAGGRFYPAGTEIPEGVAVPGGALRYEVGTDLAEYSSRKPLKETMVSSRPPPEATSHTSLFSS